MTRRRQLVALSACVFLFTLSRAQFDGVGLSVARGTGSGDVSLSWTGGEPSFHVYRSASPVQVVQPSNHLGDTTQRGWSDTPPSGAIFFYVI